MLLTLLLLTLTACSTTGRLPLDFSYATPERVEQTTQHVAERLDGVIPIERADIALVACGTVGASAYFNLAGDPVPTKEQRLAAAIDAANRHGREYYRDVLGEQSFLSFAAGRLELSQAISEAEQWIGIMRYFLTNLDEIRSRLPKEALIVN